MNLSKQEIIISITIVLVTIVLILFETIIFFRSQYYGLDKQICKCKGLKDSAKIIEK